MEKQRIYFVIDMKSFFASVECAERGLDAMTTKLVVADKTRTEKTICLAVSPALKEMGVKNRCRLFEIPKNIKYIIAMPQMKKYIKYAAEIYGIYLKYMDKSDIYVYSIDECFLDVTDYLKMYNMRAKEFALKLMGEINDKLHIPSSAGIGTNLYLAKIALDITAKHSQDRIGWLNEEKFKKELWTHKPLTDFWRISSGTVNRLAQRGIYDMRGITLADENWLYKQFGVNAELLIDHAYGKETCTMKDIKAYKTSNKSISNSQILPMEYNFEDAKLIMREMIQEGCYRLAKEHYISALVHLYIGYGDNRGEGTHGTKRMNIASNIYSVVSPYTDSLFDEIVDKDRPIRKIAFDFADLRSDEIQTYDMFTNYESIEKGKKLNESILGIREKFGKNSLLKVADLTSKATIRARNNMIGGHNATEREDDEY